MAQFIFWKASYCPARGETVAQSGIQHSEILSVNIYFHISSCLFGLYFLLASYRSPLIYLLLSSLCTSFFPRSIRCFFLSLCSCVVRWVSMGAVVVIVVVEATHKEMNPINQALVTVSSLPGPASSAAVCTVVLQKTCNIILSVWMLVFLLLKFNALMTCLLLW